jgi:hypothetical protein
MRLACHPPRCVLAQRAQQAPRSSAVPPPAVPRSVPRRFALASFAAPLLLAPAAHAAGSLFGPRAVLDAAPPAAPAGPVSAREATPEAALAALLDGRDALVDAAAIAGAEGGKRLRLRRVCASRFKPPSRLSRRHQGAPHMLLRAAAGPACPR